VPFYDFECLPCEEHEAHIHREVMMNIDYFDECGRNQICDLCGKPMLHIIRMPSVRYHGKGFYCTDYPKQVPLSDAKCIEHELENDYTNQLESSEAVEERESTAETVWVNEWRNTKTGKKEHHEIDSRLLK